MNSVSGKMVMTLGNHAIGNLNNGR
jgi:hypothetical protein